MKTRFAALLVAALLLANAPCRATAMDAIKVDVPVVLSRGDVVFNLDHAAFAGDMPVGLRYMALLNKRLKESGTKGRIVGVFHGTAAYLTLNDRAYNANRHVTTGNPYKGLISDLVKEGVEVEECAVSMQNNNWTNNDLLPGVKVNSGAVVRIMQLVQQGYVQIQP